MPPPSISSFRLAAIAFELRRVEFGQHRFYNESPEFVTLGRDFVVRWPAERFLSPDSQRRILKVQARRNSAAGHSTDDFALARFSFTVANRFVGRGGTRMMSATAFLSATGDIFAPPG